MGPVTFNHWVEGSSPSALTKNSNKTVIFSVALAMHRVGVSAPDIAGADESNLPAPESFRSTVACFESASGPKRNGPSATGELRPLVSELPAGRADQGLPAEVLALGCTKPNC